MEVHVDLAELIDLDAEIARKRAELDKLQKLIDGKKKKLSNAQFTSKAPAQVVQKERDGLQELQQKAGAISLFISAHDPSNKS
jgi:valyl-tRNA synthetase